jgi:hypothetical protein
MSVSTELGIGELISQVKKELMKAEREEKNSMFTLTEMELELNVTTSITGNGELKIALVGVGGEVQKERISKIKLKFSPQSPVYFHLTP